MESKFSAKEAGAPTDLLVAEALIRAAAKTLHADAMDTSDLEKMDRRVARIAETVDGIKEKTFTELWNRPQFWAWHIENTLPLYDADEVAPLLAGMKPSSFGGDQNVNAWTGYDFRLVGGQWHTFRDFGTRPLEPRYMDVVPIDDANKRDKQRLCENMFARREEQEVMAADHSMSVFQFLRTQTNEPPEHIVALHFVAAR